MEINTNGPDQLSRKNAKRFGVDGPAFSKASVDDAAQLDGGLAGATGFKGGIGHGRELGEEGEGALVGAVAVGLREVSRDEGHDVGLAQLDLGGAVVLAEVDGEVPVVEWAAAVDPEVGEEGGLDELLLVHCQTPCVGQSLLHFWVFEKRKKRVC